MALYSRYCTRGEHDFCFDALCECHCHTDREEAEVAA